MHKDHESIAIGYVLGRAVALVRVFRDERTTVGKRIQSQPVEQSLEVMV
jgi:hypothetical protein